MTLASIIMRIAIATRIFSPEPSAASFRLGTLASELAESGHRVRVLTVRPPRAMAPEGTPYRITRFPVLRDSSGYVRGYLQYLSFDIPLFWRIVCGPKQEAIVVEPPPTSVLFATLAAAFRRTHVFPYAADIWSDASETAGAPRIVVRAVRWAERFGWNKARAVLAVNDGVAARVREIAPRALVHTVGNGIDTEVFRPDGALPSGLDVATQTPYAIYTGTASEWQGAEVFVKAIARLAREGTPLRLVFLGQGTALPALKDLATELSAPVEFVAAVPANEAAAWQRGAAVSVASIRPDAGYDFAYPTKVFAAWGCGTPVVYAGPGPAQTDLLRYPELGEGTAHDDARVAEALKRVAFSGERSRSDIAKWAQGNVSLKGVARGVAAVIEGQPVRGRRVNDE